MKAVVLTKSGSRNELAVKEVPETKCKPYEVSIKVKATTVNGYDTIMRKKYSDVELILGMECSGIIQHIGTKVTKWKINDKVCAVIQGGGYAEVVVVSEDQVFSVPDEISLMVAAGLPYAACTVWSALFCRTKLSATFWLPETGQRLSSGERLLVHDDSNGIASFAIQLARLEGATVFVTCKTGRRECLMKLGAQCIDFADFVDSKCDLGPGVDVILNSLGPEYFQSNLACLKPGGKLICIGDFCSNVMDTHSKLPNVIDKNVAARIFITAAAFQKRSNESKNTIVREVTDHVWPHIKKVTPLFHNAGFEFAKVEEAYKLMESGQQVDKIRLVPR